MSVKNPERYYGLLSKRVEFRDGVCYWLRSVRTDVVGKVAGSWKPGNYQFIRARINGKQRYVAAHKLLWFMVHGEVPDELDHVDRDPSNNRIENLRPATRSQNMRNARFKNQKTTSKFQGVSWKTSRYGKNKGSWVAQIQIDRKKKFLGYFDTEEEAARVYDEAAIKYGVSEYAILNFSA